MRKLRRSRANRGYFAVYHVTCRHLFLVTANFTLGNCQCRIPLVDLAPVGVQLLRDRRSVQHRGQTEGRCGVPFFGVEPWIFFVRRDARRRRRLSAALEPVSRWLAMVGPFVSRKLKQMHIKSGAVTSSKYKINIWKLSQNRRNKTRACISVDDTVATLDKGKGVS